MQNQKPLTAAQEQEFFTKIKQKMEQDQFAMLAGIEIIAAYPGYAKTRMKIEQKHMNAAGVVQGGAIYTLADFAFAIATNYSDQVALAIESSLSFFHSGKTGSLWAETETLSDTRKLSSYRVNITDDTGQNIAEFYGRAFKL